MLFCLFCRCCCCCCLFFNFIMMFLPIYSTRQRVNEIASKAMFYELENLVSIWLKVSEVGNGGEKEREGKEKKEGREE